MATSYNDISVDYVILFVDFSKSSQKYIYFKGMQVTLNLPAIDRGLWDRNDPILVILEKLYNIRLRIRDILAMVWYFLSVFLWH